MGAPTNEAGLVKAIERAVKIAHPGAWVFKVHGGPMQMVGVPDLVLCVEGQFIGIEVKFQRPGESQKHALDRATPGQRMQIKKIIAAGGRAGVVTTPADALRLIGLALQNDETETRET